VTIRDNRLEKKNHENCLFKTSGQNLAGKIFPCKFLVVQTNDYSPKHAQCNMSWLILTPASQKSRSYLPFFEMRKQNMILNIFWNRFTANFFKIKTPVASIAAVLKQIF
jgi:hypothetical protein